MATNTSLRTRARRLGACGGLSHRFPRTNAALGVVGAMKEIRRFTARVECSMYSPFRAACLALLLSIPACGIESQRADSGAILRVCADPNNLPFSNIHGEGFENAIAELLAHDLGRKVAYTWWPWRRGFIRNTLRAEHCDVVIGVPSRFELAATTSPYYRSSYVFVTRRDRKLALTSFDDAQLRQLRIGLHAIGDDYTNVPPAQALAARGIVNNIVAYSIYGDYSLSDPPRRLIDAVADGDIDVAIAWGPLAGYFASRESVPLALSPIDPTTTPPRIPMAFDISMGTRRDDQTLHQEIEIFLVHRRADIERVLLDYGVPLVGIEEGRS
jgi:mxaJ protein